MANQQIHAHGGGNNPENEGDNAAAGQVNIDKAGTDDLLDEIDGLLESNAEEFVRSYVQKGGQ